MNHFDTFYFLITFCASLAAPVSASVLRIPLQFEENDGQYPNQVQFVGRTAACHAIIDGPRLRLGIRENRPSGPAHGRSAPEGISWIGANPSARFKGEEPSSSNTSYFMGSDSAHWKSHVSAFSKVKCHDFYRGIDLVFCGTDRPSAART